MVFLGHEAIARALVRKILGFYFLSCTGFLPLENMGLWVSLSWRIFIPIRLPWRIHNWSMMLVLSLRSNQLRARDRGLLRCMLDAASVRLSTDSPPVLWGIRDSFSGIGSLFPVHILRKVR